MREPVTSTSGLKTFLADTYALMIKTHVFHWNVADPHFRSLHLMFEDQYKELFEAADEVAERIRALGDIAPGGLESFLELTSISDPQGEAGADEMLSRLVADHLALANRAKECAKAANQAGDDATADLLLGRIREHEKQIWMMQSMQPRRA